MRISRIYTEQPLHPDQEISLEPNASHHLIQVLRLRPGAELTLFNGDGRNYHARLKSIAKKQVLVKVMSCSDPESENTLNIHLCIAVSKGERMDWAIQKSVEMGVTEITPLFSKHGVVHLKGDRLHKRELHWRKVMLAACEQSGRCRIPVLHNAMEMDKWIHMPLEGTGLILHPQAEIGINALEQPASKVNILVGPEGGFSEAELTAAASSGFNEIRLGPRILRTETAPVAAIAAMQTLWGDFRT